MKASDSSSCPPAFVQRRRGHISLGKDFMTKGDLGGAARSYWAALELVSRTIASRPDRERIIRAAYEGLEAIAEARGQRKWGKLMRFCSHLAGTYLDSSQAREDNANFYAQMNILKTAEQEMEQAQSEANSQLMQGLLLGAFAGVGAAGAFMNGASSQFGNYVGQGVMQLSESKINYDQAVATITDLAGKTNEQYRMIRFAAATDVEEITAANSFVGNEFLFYVKNAKDPRPYLQLLDRFAANKPQLKSVLTSYSDESRVQATPEFLTKVRDELVQIEIFVSKYERRGKVPPPEETQAVWS